ncbi:intermembrane phospholipid transport protein YdbH family protein [Shewanella sedimentimangrovi]|uniref:YdbH domain-containing protein n=1 Tax=Shewanella sedimentimangrovi TaxID=2814293 RepID=A0ABX7QWF1_9GAMM|nr:YdbH domain-containing protein [Shewanella sedimentimangrovi]QSX35819.1 YdbH domain-containing protein [Shewanella sedimentimangrovi]
MLKFRLRHLAWIMALLLIMLASVLWYQRQALLQSLANSALQSFDGSAEGLALDPNLQGLRLERLNFSYNGSHIALKQVAIGLRKPLPDLLFDTLRRQGLNGQTISALTLAVQQELASLSLDSAGVQLAPPGNSRDRGGQGLAIGLASLPQIALGPVTITLANGQSLSLDYLSLDQQRLLHTALKLDGMALLNLDAELGREQWQLQSELNLANLEPLARAIKQVDGTDSLWPLLDEFEQAYQARGIRLGGSLASTVSLSLTDAVISSHHQLENFEFKGLGLEPNWPPLMEFSADSSPEGQSFNLSPLTLSLTLEPSAEAWTRLAGLASAPAWLGVQPLTLALNLPKGLGARHAPDTSSLNFDGRLALSQGESKANIELSQLQLERDGLGQIQLHGDWRMQGGASIASLLKRLPVQNAVESGQQHWQLNDDAAINLTGSGNLQLKQGGISAGREATGQQLSLSFSDLELALTQLALASTPVSIPASTQGSANAKPQPTAMPQALKQGETLSLTLDALSLSLAQPLGLSLSRNALNHLGVNGSDDEWQLQASAWQVQLQLEGLKADRQHPGVQNTGTQNKGTQDKSQDKLSVQSAGTELTGPGFSLDKAQLDALLQLDSPQPFLQTFGELQQEFRLKSLKLDYSRPRPGSKRLENRHWQLGQMTFKGRLVPENEGKTLATSEQWQLDDVGLSSSHKLTWPSQVSDQASDQASDKPSPWHPAKLTANWQADNSLGAWLRLGTGLLPMPPALRLSGDTSVRADVAMDFASALTQIHLTPKLSELEGAWDNLPLQGGSAEANCRLLHSGVEHTLELGCPSVRWQLASFNPGVIVSDIQGRGDLALGQAADGSLSALNINLTSEGKLLDGEFLLPEFALRLTEPSSAYLVLQGLSLEKLLELQPVTGIYADGIFDGVLPVKLAQGQVSVSGGKLAARAPGGLIMVRNNPAVEQMRASQPYLEFAFSALEHLQYSSLASSFDMAPAGDALMKVEVKGRNPGIERPIHLNYSQEENLLQLLKSLRIGEDLQSQIEQSVK